VDRRRVGPRLEHPRGDVVPQLGEARQQRRRAVAVEAGDFPAPYTNTGSVGSGQLRFAQADATGQGGVVVVARVRFQALAAGAANATLAVSELSAAQTFTNLISVVTVTNGTVTVR